MVYAGTMKKEFPSWEAFMGWKESEEAASHTYFVQPKGKSTSGLKDPGQLLPKPTTASRYEGSLARSPKRKIVPSHRN